MFRKLIELYDLGRNNKKRKVGTERAHPILDTILVGNCAEMLHVTIPKINAFFALTPNKQKSTIEQLKDVHLHRSNSLRDSLHQMYQ